MLKRLVGGDGDGVSLVARGDEFEQRAGLDLVLASWVTSRGNWFLAVPVELARWQEDLEKYRRIPHAQLRQQMFWAYDDRNRAIT